MPGRWVLASASSVTIVHMLQASILVASIRSVRSLIMLPTTVRVYPKLGPSIYNYANAMLSHELFHTANHLFKKFFHTELDIAVNGVAS